MIGQTSHSNARKTNSKIVTLKKLRKHCSSPGVQQLFRNNRTTLQFEDKKQRGQCLREATNSQKSIATRSPMLDAANCKKSLLSLQRARPAKSAAEEERDRNFRLISGCVVSASPDACFEPAATTSSDTTSVKVAISPEKHEDKSHSETACTPYVLPNHNQSWPKVSCHVISEKGRRRCKELRNLESQSSDARSMERVFKAVEMLRDGLNPASLFKINPRLRMSSNSLRRLKLLLENQSSPVTLSDSESDDDFSENSGIPASDKTYSSFFGRSNEDCIMSEVASSFPDKICTPCSYPNWNKSCEEILSFDSHPWKTNRPCTHSGRGTHEEYFKDSEFAVELNNCIKDEEYSQEPLFSFERFCNSYDNEITEMNSVMHPVSNRFLLESHETCGVKYSSSTSNLSHYDETDPSSPFWNDRRTLTARPFSLLRDGDTSPPNVFEVPGRVI